LQPLNLASWNSSRYISSSPSKKLSYFFFVPQCICPLKFEINYYCTLWYASECGVVSCYCTPTLHQNKHPWLGHIVTIVQTYSWSDMTQSYVILVMIIGLLVSYNYDITTTWLESWKVVKLNMYMGRLNKLSLVNRLSKKVKN
jgi:hypothetical protein